MLRRFSRQQPTSGWYRVATSKRFQSVPERRNLHKYDSYLSGASAAYIDELFLKFKKDPNAVDESWREIFEHPLIASYDSPTLNAPLRVVAEGGDQQASDASAVGVHLSLFDCARLIWMIQAFEDRGHLAANLDPLDHNRPDDSTKCTRIPTRKVRDNLGLSLESFAFTPDEFDKVVKVGFQQDVGGLLDTRTQPMTIRQLHATLTRIYCNNVGYEFTHIINEEQAKFLRDNIESERDPLDPLHKKFSTADKQWILNQLGSAVFFEDYFTRKHSDQKRFGLDGGESLVVGLMALLNRAADCGTQQVILGMAHRGRLSLLHHICGKPFEVILKEFTGIKGAELEPFKMQADVKYHLGHRSNMPTRNGKVLDVEMLPNPSHLEAVNPFVQGKVKAAQFEFGKEGHKRVLPIELHGDAAFSGQGVVYETMGISEVLNYHTGGTIHVVVNNQIGFTTDPKSSRSSAYCTDLGRTFQCPIFHVNSDCPEDVVRVFELAGNFRNTFHKSVVIDLVCYRRNGHNENDDPTMTQPVMYAKVKSTPHIFARYADTLVQQNVMTKDQVTEIQRQFKAHYDALAKKVSTVKYAQYLLDTIPPSWKKMKYSNETGSLLDASITAEKLAPVIAALKTLPEGFKLHEKLKTIIDRRNDGLAKGKDIEWGTAEALALGSLLQEGYHVRISGQDVERATFSQRHAVFHDQSTNHTYCQLANISATQAPITITNSPLSEFGVLGYDAGYALHNPNSLVMWEAQFGDFANGATVIFDQFLSAAETKWNQQHSVIVSMPHGYDGNGPEHSSGRIERFLQGVSEDAETPALSISERHQRCNWEVTFPSTPAQYFHLLRRHMRRDFRKPLINFFSKQFLRAPNVSTLNEIVSGSFQPLIGDPSVPPSRARRVVLCTGQIYHLLNHHRHEVKSTDVAIIRIEQLAPFPVAEVLEILKEYPTQELMWAQEEPKNMGAFWHVQERIEAYTNGRRELIYNGRATSASPSTGFKYVHTHEQSAILSTAFAH